MVQRTFTASFKLVVGQAFQQQAISRDTLQINDTFQTFLITWQCNDNSSMGLAVKSDNKYWDYHPTQSELFRFVFYIFFAVKQRKWNLGL